MNNQAAQTMPPLPAPYSMATGFALFNSAQMHQYARDYAAALSQTAGVVEPNGKLVGWWNGIMPDVTERSPYGPSVRWGADAEDSAHDIPLYDGYNPIHYRQPDALAAAPAASGGEDGWSLAMRVREALDRASCPDHFMRIAVETITGDAPQPPAGASVSERARDWLDAYDNAVSDLFADEETGWNEGNRRHWMRRRIDRLRAILIAALEQALTQQRGEYKPASTPAGHVSREQLADYIHGWLTKLAPVEYGSLTRLHDDLYVMCGGMVKLYTTPQPGAEALRELVQRWRDESQLPPLPDAAYAQARVCASELESLLARGGK